MARSEDFRCEFAHVIHEILDENTLELIEDGSIEICPYCKELSAYAYQDTTAYGDFADDIIPGGFKPAMGTIAHIGTASCYEWECGHCGANCAEVDSPILAPCYTHSDD